MSVCQLCKGKGTILYVNRNSEVWQKAREHYYRRGCDDEHTCTLQADAETAVWIDCPYCGMKKSTI